MSAQIMAVINVTNNSYFESSRKTTPADILAQAEMMLEQGADILDIGAEASNPSAEPTPVEIELERIAMALEVLLPLGAKISVDTRRTPVMELAIKAGVYMINDIDALTAPGALEAVAPSDAKVCLMHKQGEPQTMQNNPSYENVVQEVFDYLSERRQAAIAAGIGAERIVLDPGFGFGKTDVHNMQLLQQLARFQELGSPLLVGISRKRTIRNITGRDTADSLPGTLAAHTIALMNGANIIRTHDVAATRDIIKIFHALEEASAA